MAGHTVTHPTNLGSLSVPNLKMQGWHYKQDDKMALAAGHGQHFLYALTLNKFCTDNWLHGNSIAGLAPNQFAMVLARARRAKIE